MRVPHIFAAFFYALVVSLAVFAMSTSVVYADDSLILSPSSGTYNLDNSFSVQVVVSSAAQSINAVSGLINFPTDKLQVSSVSTTGSVVTLWVTQPTFSNAAGTVSFEGIIPNPGFQGPDAVVATINFKVIAGGSAPVSFSSASVLANDGQGTNILKTIGSASFTLGTSNGQVVVPATPSFVPSSGTPPAPNITSSTHPNQNDWYTSTTAELSWNNSPDTIATRVLFGRLSDAVPTVVYKPAISSKELTDITPGVWHFHVQDENANGWGAISDFVIKVDTTPPESFVMKEIPRSDPTDPNVQLSLSSLDSISGTPYYTIQIDKADPVKWVDDGTGVYNTGPLAPGDHSIIGKVFDGAGNFDIASVDVNVVGIATPSITEYPQQAKNGDLVRITGTALPNVTIDVFATSGSNTPIDNQVTSDKSGSWSAVFEKPLTSGAYTIYAVATDSRGAKSLPSQSVVVIVSTPIIFVIGSYALNALIIIIPTLALIFLLIFLVFFATYKLRLMKKNFRKELHGAEFVIDNSFKVLQEDLEDHIRLLERAKTRRTLTNEEEALIKRLKNNISDIEKVVHKKMGDIDQRFS